MALGLWRSGVRECQAVSESVCVKVSVRVQIPMRARFVHSNSGSSLTDPVRERR